MYPKIEVDEVCCMVEDQVQIDEKSGEDMLSGQTMLPDFMLLVTKIFAVKKTKTNNQ